MSQLYRAVIIHDALPQETLDLLKEALRDAGFGPIEIATGPPASVDGPQLWIMADRFGHNDAFDVVRRIKAKEVDLRHPVVTGVVLGLGYRPIVMEHFNEDRPDLFIVDAPMLDANLWEASIASTAMPQVVRLAFGRMHRTLEMWTAE